MIHLGLVGYPLGHSLSPKIHNAALAACELEGEYSLFPIHADDKAGLAGLVSRVRSSEIMGLNVTIPHKQNVILFLDELTPTAQSIGAVNTIYLRSDRLIGDNTDAAGFLADLKKFLTTEAWSHGDQTALVLGAGGSARAVVYALLSDGWQVTLTARRIEQAQQLAHTFTSSQFPNSHLQPATFNDLQSSTFNLIVNTTPLGMLPDIDRSPWPENLPFPPRAAIYDLVYNPHQTKLVADALAQGLSATTGLGMLVEQAALSFKIWTSYDPPREIMFESINQSPITNL